jgi:hypothetical protein
MKFDPTAARLSPLQNTTYSNNDIQNIHSGRTAT